MEVATEATSAAIAAAASAIVVYPLDTILVRYQASSRRKLTDPYTAAAHLQSGHKELVNIIWELIRERPADDARDLSPHKKLSLSAQKAADAYAAPEDVIVDLLDTLRKLYKGVGVKVFEAVVRNVVYFIWYKLLKEAYDRRGTKQTVASRLMLATAAAVINQCCTAPLEVVSTNVQTTGLNYRYVIRKIFRREGLRGFYRGFAASLILCSNPAITNACFDRLKLLLQVVVEKQARRNIDPILDEETPLDTSRRLLPLTSTQAFLLGALSKALATVVTYPYIRSKVLLHVQCTGASSHHEASSPESSRSPTPEGLLSVTPPAAGENQSTVSPALSPLAGSPLGTRCESEGGEDSVSSLRYSPSSPLYPPPPVHRTPLRKAPSSSCLSSCSSFLHTGTLGSAAGLSGSSSSGAAASPRLGLSASCGAISRLPARAQPGEQSPGRPQSHDAVAGAARAGRAADKRAKRQPTPEMLPGIFVDPNDMLKAASFCLSDKVESPGVVGDGKYHAFDLRTGDEVIAPRSHAERETGIVAFMISTLAQEGLLGLYRGLGLQLCKTLIASAILYMIKERVTNSTYHVGLLGLPPPARRNERRTEGRMSLYL
ncbi:carrier superfamily protein [Besnoitia besnoiti]|uniref:Carrier superfamily protein n=1 Tax=Besnoitia besnoiti TaxID=94643 RepID=A0A2A9MME1_BESBE|nr:carrier superfamily protein [Besnoitia besnoiti]PFH37266.1 carrier superfamily protein [Besnoitia besnoiti]